MWILNTTWNGQKYTFAMNGQTGKLTGTGHIGQGDQRGIKHPQSLADGHGTETEADGKITQANGHAAADTLAVFFPVQKNSLFSLTFFT